MAVKYVQQKNNTLGMLGSLATLGGMATGQGWLTTLGSGLGAANSMMNGEKPSNEELGNLSEILKKIPTWINPAKNNIGKASGIVQTVNDVVGKTQVPQTLPQIGW